MFTVLKDVGQPCERLVPLVLSWLLVTGLGSCTEIGGSGVLVGGGSGVLVGGGSGVQVKEGQVCWWEEGQVCRWGSGVLVGGGSGVLVGEGQVCWWGEGQVCWWGEGKVCRWYTCGGPNVTITVVKRKSDTQYYVYMYFCS